jgi:hypothetical protein
MEQSGKVIIFDTEEEAKIWFEAIKDTKNRGMIESKRMEMESWMKMMNEANDGTK